MSTIIPYFEILAAPQGINHLHDIEDQFLQSLIIFTADLARSRNIQQAIWLYEKSIELTQERSHQLFYHYAKFTVEYQPSIGTLKACRLLLKCLNIDPLFVEAIECLENLKNQIVDRWHFRMLNDHVRNQAYRDAITKAVKRSPNCTVLDIGGGCGILSIFAALAGASHVYCCEMSVELSQIARECIVANNLSHKITVISKHSSRLQVQQASYAGHNASEANNSVVDKAFDLPSRVDIVVTELLDSGLLGEHILPVLEHAKSHLLRAGGIMIPHSATVHMKLIESDPIRCRKSVKAFSSTKTQTVGLTCNVDYDAYLHNTLSLALRELVANPYDRVTVDDRYTCEWINSTYPHVSLSDSINVGSINFSNPMPNQQQPRQYDVKIIQSGCIDAFVYWFALYLEPPDCAGVEGNVTIEFSSAGASFSTHASRPNNGWDQAVIFNNCNNLTFSQQAQAHEYLVAPSTTNAAHPMDTVIYAAGDIVTVSVRFGSDDVYIELASTMEVGDKCGVVMNSHSSGQTIEYDKILAGEMDIAKLNDTEYREKYFSALSSVISTINGLETTVERTFKSLHIMEFASLYQSIALFALIIGKYIKQNAALENSTFESIEHVHVHCNREENLKFLSQLKKTFLPDFSDKVAISCGNIVEHYISSKKESSIAEATNENGTVKIFICDLIDGSGVMNCMALKDLVFALQYMSPSACSNESIFTPDTRRTFSKKPQPLVTVHTNDRQRGSKVGVIPALSPVISCYTIPFRVEVILALLECPLLVDHHRVNPNRTLQAQVAEQINFLGATYLRELDLSTLPDIRYLSEPTVAASFTLASLPHIMPSPSDNTVSRERVTVLATSAGCAHAVAIWFNLILTPDNAVSISTGPNILQQMNRSDCMRNAQNKECDKPQSGPLSCRHWRQAAWLIPSDSPSAQSSYTLDKDQMTKNKMIIGDCVCIEVCVDARFGVVCSIPTTAH